MIPTSAPWASQTGKAPILSALSRVQIDVIDSSGMQVSRICRLDLRTSDTRMKPPFLSLDLSLLRFLANMPPELV
jgi:hypothetical protein